MVIRCAYDSLVMQMWTRWWKELLYMAIESDRKENVLTVRVAGKKSKQYIRMNNILMKLDIWKIINYESFHGLSTVTRPLWNTVHIQTTTSMLYGLKIVFRLPWKSSKRLREVNIFVGQKKMQNNFHLRNFSISSSLRKYTVL